MLGGGFNTAEDSTEGIQHLPLGIHEEPRPPTRLGQECNRIMVGCLGGLASLHLPLLRSSRGWVPTCCQGLIGLPE
eukprot:13745776-Alexandrium_andersonii.AAC.1